MAAETSDSDQYGIQSIRRYEAIFGADFVSPGGREFATELIQSLPLQPGDRVLDAGCGLGGSAFIMAGEFGFRVDAIDLSDNMLALAREKLQHRGLDERVTLLKRDCLELDDCDTYHGIYSRDVFLHIANKNKLFDVLYRAIRPGGMILFTDYCCGEQPWSPEFASYVKDRGYTLHTVDNYAELIREAGFTSVQADDITDRFAFILKEELLRITALDEDCSEELAASWRGKLERAQSGEQRWGMFRAVKPAAVKP